MVRFELKSDDGGDAVVIDWGETRLVRASDPSFVFVTAPEITRVTVGGAPLPLLRAAGSTTAATKLEGGSVIGPVRVEASAAGQVPARLDVLMPAAEHALDEFLRSIRLADVALPRLRGGLVYLDSTGVPRRAVDPYRVAVFIKDNLQAVAALCREVDDDPWRASVYRRPVRPPGPAVDINATRDLLIARPELIAAAPFGIIESPGGPVAPSLVVARVASSTVDVPENRRIARFIGRLWFEADSVARSGVLTGDDLAELLSAQGDLAAVMAGTLFGDLATIEGEELVLEASAVEREDVRYAALHELRVRYLTEVVATADPAQLERQSTARPDEVFQGLCTLLLAASFGLERGRDPEGRERWESADWFMYANRVGALRSWRSGTARPDDYRPDFVLIRRLQPSRFVLLDAKASVDSSGHVPGERLKEVQAYLNAFGVHRGGVLFPGPMDRARTVVVDDIANHGYLLRELPVRPVEPEELPQMLENLRDRVLELEDESDLAEAT